MILVILRLIVAIATPCFGSETQSLAMPCGAHLQSVFFLLLFDNIMLLYETLKINNINNYISNIFYCLVLAALFSFHTLIKTITKFRIYLLYFMTTLCVVK